MEHRRMIKQGAVVVATHEDGSIEPTGTFSQGLFVGDTRFLNRFQIHLNSLKPSLMGSSEEELYQVGYLHTNPELTGIPARSIQLAQRNKIDDGIVTIWLQVTNRTIEPIEFELSLDIDADFFDSFEARGVKREKRGQAFEPEVSSKLLKLQYLGLDGARRSTSWKSN